MAIICDMSEALMIYLNHLPNFLVVCKGISKLSPLYHLTYIYSVPVQCCSTLHQAVTSQLGDNIQLHDSLLYLSQEMCLTLMYLGIINLYCFRTKKIFMII